MSKQQHTPGPWKLGDYDETLGYDCMTGGVKAGPVYLDGASYGQDTCTRISEDQLSRMMADARLIASAPDQNEALELTQILLERLGLEQSDEYQRNAAALAKARGES